MTYLSIWKLSATSASDPTAYPVPRQSESGSCVYQLTDNELNKEKRRVDGKQNFYASWTRETHGGRDEENC
jgi:hypothetical protein